MKYVVTVDDDTEFDIQADNYVVDDKGYLWFNDQNGIVACFKAWLCFVRAA